MPHESGIRQRAIVGRRLDLADSELLTKYTLPFVDASWKVPFVVLDLVGSPPRIFAEPINWDGSRLHSTGSKADLRRIESVPLEDLAHLVHYDPWWVFRRVSGIGRAWIEAVFATNIATPFRYGGRTHKVRDLIFSAELDRLEEIEARVGLFRSVTFHPGDVELLSLRPAPRAQSNLRTVRTAKAL